MGRDMKIAEADAINPSFVRSALVDCGFEGWTTFARLRKMDACPEVGGVYVVARAAQNSFGEGWKGSSLTEVFYAIGGMYSAVLLWLMLHAGVDTNQSTATLITLVLYVIVGLIFYFIGKTYNKEVQTKIGVLIIALVIIRLFFVDVWTLSLLARIVTFLLVGALVMTTAFFKPSKQ